MGSESTCTCSTLTDLLKPGEVDTLVEGDIIELDHAIARVAAAGDDELIVECEVQLRRAREVGLHLNRAVDREGPHLCHWSWTVAEMVGGRLRARLRLRVEAR